MSRKKNTYRSYYSNGSNISKACSLKINDRAKYLYLSSSKKASSSFSKRLSKSRNMNTLTSCRSKLDSKFWRCKNDMNYLSKNEILHPKSTNDSSPTLKSTTEAEHDMINLSTDMERLSIATAVEKPLEVDRVKENLSIERSLQDDDQEQRE